MSKDGLSAVPVVAIDGATGYLGSHLTAKLASVGIAVRCLVRPGVHKPNLELLKSFGAEVFTVTFNDNSFKKALEEVNTVVHLIGSIAPPKGLSFRQLHVDQTKSLVNAATESGVSKIIMVSALGTKRNALSLYHATKWEAEEHLKNSMLNYVILRPSLVLGRQVGFRNSKLVARYMHLIYHKTFVPLIGGGNNRLQPVFVGDVVEVLLQTIITNSFDKKVLEIAGADVVTMKELVLMLMEVLAVKKPLLEIPYPMARILAFLCESCQNIPTVSCDQLKLSAQDNISTYNSLVLDFKRTPTSLKEALNTYKNFQAEFEKNKAFMLSKSSGMN